MSRAWARGSQEPVLVPLVTLLVCAILLFLHLSDGAVPTQAGPWALTICSPGGEWAHNQELGFCVPSLVVGLLGAEAGFLEEVASHWAVWGDSDRARARAEQRGAGVRGWGGGRADWGPDVRTFVFQQRR